MEWFPSGSPNTAAEGVETQRIGEAAETLRKLDPDVIVVQEVRDLETCEKLATALSPQKYLVSICSRFKDEFGSGLGRQQVAILSKTPAITAWSDKWKTFGVVDPPRGYAFAAFRYGTNDVGVYSVHLKSNLTRNDPQRGNQLNILKRELSAEQIIQHANEVEARLTNHFEALVVGGDFNTNQDQDSFVSEKTLRLFRMENFSSGFEDLPIANRVTHPGKGRYPDATFDYIFVKGRPAGEPQIFTSLLSDHRPVTREINLGPSRN